MFSTPEDDLVNAWEDPDGPEPTRHSPKVRRFIDTVMEQKGTVCVMRGANRRLLGDAVSIMGRMEGNVMLPDSVKVTFTRK